METFRLYTKDARACPSSVQSETCILNKNSRNTVNIIMHNSSVLGDASALEEAVICWENLQMTSQHLA
jgi:hypothetical protein